MSYDLRAAEILGLIREDQAGEFVVTSLGSSLLATDRGGVDEGEVLRRAIAESAPVSRIAPGLLNPREPRLERLAERIETVSALSSSTARRRAQTLLSWRRQLLGASGQRRPSAVQRRTTPLLGTVSAGASTLSEILRRDNPWWGGQPGKELPSFRRDFVAAIRRRLERGLAPIVVVRGPRQVGKTTAQLQIIQDLVSEGVPPRSLLRVQFDELKSFRELARMDEPILKVVDWYEREILQRTLNAAARDGQPTYVFLDEAQNLPDWAIQLKHLVDATTTKVIVTGSSALRIEAGRDSLAGRITTLEVGTLSLREVSELRFGVTIPALLPENGLDRLTTRVFWEEMVRHGRAHAAARDQAFGAFSERGGYPLVHANPTGQWPEIAEQLNETVIRKVIQHDLRVGDSGRKRDPQLLEELFRLACRYAGQAPSSHTLAREIQRALHANVGVPRVRQYLDFLDRALLVRLVRPLEIRLKKAQGNSKLCLTDHGLRASWLQEVVPLLPRKLEADGHLADLAGRIAESVTGAYLKTFGGLQVAHLPERNGEPEVDFIITIGTVRIPLEVKYRRRIDGMSDTEGLRTFIEKRHNNAPFGVLVTQSEVDAVLDPRIVTVPLSSLLLTR